MTEHDWLTSTDLLPMLEYLHGRVDVSDRQMRLLLAGGARLIWDAMTDPLMRRAVTLAEQHADGHVTDDELQTVKGSLFKAYCEWGLHAGERWHFHFGRAIIATYKRFGDFDMTAWMFAVSKRADDYTNVLRDIFGNPFRPTTISQECLRWNDETVPRVARRIYEERRFEDLPILADAIEESGCSEVEILRHCRQPGVHVRGCWVLDRILGME